ncbi:MAG: di-heme oxidoredictase family protein [Gemmatimonadota bacterium]
MRRFIPPYGAAALFIATIGCYDDRNPTHILAANPPPAADEVLSTHQLEAASFGKAFLGGATTVFDATESAFSTPAPNLDANALALHEEGDEAFGDVFDASTGLGPLFHNVSCEHCHIEDGRGRPPEAGEVLETMLFRVSLPGQGAHGAPKPVPGFGDQLQTRAISGVLAEGDVHFTYTTVNGQYADGTPFSLRAPTHTLINPYTSLPTGVLLGPRIAPAVFGLGLLEAVPAALLFALSDPNDRNRDGISGRVNIVYDAALQRNAVGRFGLKANQPNLRQQSAGAYNGDMGVTTSLFPAENCEGQLNIHECARHAIEVEDEVLDASAFYVRTLAVPARRDVNDRQALRGELLFLTAGCAACHTPILATGTLPGVPAVSNQIIRPFTDLLLHDMGPGLADNRPDFLASGREWRTPPLWGIGLVQTVNGHSTFLHDGRARNIEEAVLWHGGEAQASRERFRRMTASDRAALLQFLHSL